MRVTLFIIISFLLPSLLMAQNINLEVAKKLFVKHPTEFNKKLNKGIKELNQEQILNLFCIECFSESQLLEFSNKLKLSPKLSPNHTNTNWFAVIQTIFIKDEAPIEVYLKLEMEYNYKVGSQQWVYSSVYIPCLDDLCCNPEDSFTISPHDSNVGFSSIVNSFESANNFKSYLHTSLYQEHIYPFVIMLQNNEIVFTDNYQYYFFYDLDNGYVFRTNKFKYNNTKSSGWLIDKVFDSNELNTFNLQDYVD